MAFCFSSVNLTNIRQGILAVADSGELAFRSILCFAELY